MECFPPCGAKCSGLCKRVPDISASPDKSKRRKSAPKVVTPRKLPGYIVLICGKYTTPEAQRIIFATLRRRFPSSLTRRTKFWCEVHQAWTRPYTFSERIRDDSETLPYLEYGSAGKSPGALLSEPYRSIHAGKENLRCGSVRPVSTADTPERRAAADARITYHTSTDRSERIEALANRLSKRSVHKTERRGELLLQPQRDADAEIVEKAAAVIQKRFTGEGKIIEQLDWLANRIREGAGDNPLYI